MRRILLDTNAIYAFTISEDPLHTTAADFLRAEVRAGTRFILTDWVFLEAVTLLKVRRGARAAIATGTRLRSATFYEWMPFQSEDEVQAWAIFQRYADKDWSYVDCGLLTLAVRLKVPVFTFDHHFEQMPGVVKLPE